MYKILRSILFMFDAEKVHHFSMKGLKLLCKIGSIKKIIVANYSGCELEVAGHGLTNSKPLTRSSQLLQLPFKNPVGLAAGFDKNAKYLNELEVLGFGCIEIGTVTPLPQDGNPTPRLFRLPKDKALINRMGFNNEGVAKVVERLHEWKKLKSIENQTRSEKRETKERIIIGGNIGKNKLTPNENAFKDYEICFDALHNYVDYFVVNVSSPNTPGLRELQEKEPLKKILTHLQTLNKNFYHSKPILLKIAPDLSQIQIDDIINLAQEINLDGLVVANTSLDRSKLVTPNSQLATIGAGGLSGLPVKQRATEMVKHIHSQTGGKIPIIASGGIFTGEDAAEKLNAGASLVQVWTGFVYEGPAIVKNICRYLAGENRR
ncbi:MAG: quinone-dependent dihydroorotate dehydrogenase [Ferruginibacter sp.]